MLRHFLSQNDLSAEEIHSVLARASALKPAQYSIELLGRSLVMFFEKSSTRTRLSFEIGMTQLGGHAIYLDRESSQLSRGESIEDTARVVSRYADLIMARVFAHETVETLAGAASVPVLNGLSDEEHPCQTMADLLTMLECKGGLKGLRIAFLGDGNNNMTHSLILAATRVGAHITVAAPPNLQPLARYVDFGRSNASESGGSLTITSDSEVAVTDADVIYTDVWVSMGREADRQARLELLAPYQVNRELAERARPDHIFMHCLPAHIGEEVTAEVAYGPNSVIFDEAENRLHVQKALMLFLFESNRGGS